MALQKVKFEEDLMDEHDRLLVLERDVAHIDKTLSEMKVDMKSGFGEMSRKFDAINEKIDGKFNFTLGMFGGGVLLIIGFIYICSDPGALS